MPIKKRLHSPASGTKAKRATTQPVEIPDIFLQLTTSVLPTWGLQEPENYLTHLSGNACLSLEDSDCLVVGTVSAFLVRLSNALDDGVPWFDILDSYNDEIARCSALIEPDGSCYTEWAQAELEPFASDLLILDRIRVEPQYRGRGYGLQAAQLLIQAFGPPGGVVACIPAPYELREKYRISHLEEAASTSHEELMREWDPAQKKLREFWSLLGFERVPQSDVFALSLARRRPDMEDVLRKYFERKSVR